MKIAIFAYSRRGCCTARKIAGFFAPDEVRMYTLERFAEPEFLPIGSAKQEFYGSLFSWADGLVFVGSCGIAVRQIAPHVKDKQTDPAVLVVDELGTFVIPLLSGHIGGANQLALKLSEHLSATAVVTTATDINKRFSVDAWAAEKGFTISDIKAAKAVSAAILEHNVPMLCDFPVVTDYPSGVAAGTSGEVGICISYEQKEPFANTLRLIPKVLHLGIGCRRGTDASAIEQVVELVLSQHNIDRRAIKSAASIDLKADEPGLLQFCKDNHWPISFFSAQALGKVVGDFTPSQFVAKVTGVDNVCERAALMGADHLIVRKTACNGVTVALAAENLEVRFG